MRYCGRHHVFLAVRRLTRRVLLRQQELCQPPGRQGGSFYLTQACTRQREPLTQQGQIDASGIKDIDGGVMRHKYNPYMSMSTPGVCTWADVSHISPPHELEDAGQLSVFVLLDHLTWGDWRVTCRVLARQSVAVTVSRLVLYEEHPWRRSLSCSCFCTLSARSPG